MGTGPIQVFQEVLDKIDDSQHRQRMREILEWVAKNYPQLEPVVKWNQPMFQHHGTFIVGFSTSKKHFAFTPEAHTISVFEDRLAKSGLSHTKMIIRVPWDADVPYDLMGEVIEFNIEDKADTTSFWRK